MTGAWSEILWRSPTEEKIRAKSGASRCTLGAPCPNGSKRRARLPRSPSRCYPPVLKQHTPAVATRQVSSNSEAAFGRRQRYRRRHPEIQARTSGEARPVSARFLVRSRKGRRTVPGQKKTQRDKKKRKRDKVSDRLSGQNKTNIWDKKTQTGHKKHGSESAG